MTKLLIATKNKGKLKEFQHFLGDLPVELVSLSDVGIDSDVDEDGLTYEANSEKKARIYASSSGLPTLSDDGGLEIVALDNEPGIHSRRWLGYEASDEELMEHLGKVSKELPEDNRVAYFRTVVSIVLPDGQLFQERGEVKGEIAKEPLMNLSKGYPYRSFFFIPELGKYYHESDLSEEEEKLYNHRYKAVVLLKPVIMQHIIKA